MAPDETLPRDSAAASDFWGHPRLLWMLLAVTVGLNFAFYGFRAFLAPYAAEAFFSGLPQAEALKQANFLFAGFGALTYATAILGGWVADNMLGEVQALRISLWLATLGILALAWPTREGFTLALAFFVLAAGLGIPLTVLIGRNYGKGDSRRDAGYTLFYLAINLGGFIAPFICAAWIGVHYGYRWGFIAAACGMAFGALVFELRHRRMSGAREKVRFQRRWSAPAVIVAMLVLLWPCAWLLAHPTEMTIVVYALMGLLVLYFVGSSLRRRDRVQAHRYLAMLILFVAMVLFWAWSLESASALNFFARDYVDAPFNFTLFQSVNPLYILILAVPLSLLWPWLDRRGINPSTPRKFGIGLLLVALGYGVLLAATHFLVGADGHIDWWPLMLWYLFATLGELALSPIGYAMIGNLAASDEASIAMGGWFFGVSVSYDLAGQIAAMTTSGGIAGYSQVFAGLFVVGVAIALLFLVAAPWIVKLMHGVR
ncbi:MAG TPA: oligopeptide:H+ symporter [Gammaproteobacteria bacterium]|nr:oligopeptide:H+ symporter [Gammaproteobacteria bacterium]